VECDDTAARFVIPDREQLPPNAIEWYHSALLESRHSGRATLESPRVFRGRVCFVVVDAVISSPVPGEPPIVCSLRYNLERDQETFTEGVYDFLLRYSFACSRSFCLTLWIHRLSVSKSRLILASASFPCVSLLVFASENAK
jgi:hypothetical protein